VESSLRMWEYNGSWSQAPSPNGVNTVENYVYANLTSFSVFAPMADTPPSITIVSPSNTTYSSTSIALNVSADEAISAWLYSLNGASNVTFTPNTTITASEGANNIVVYANDTMGNWGSASRYFTVSLSSPLDTGGGGGGGAAVPPGLVVQVVDVTPKGVADLVGQFLYISREFHVAPAELAGVLGSLGHVPTSEVMVEELDMKLASPVKTIIGVEDLYTIATEKVLQKYSMANRVIITRGDLGVDSLAAVAYARALKAPILLVKPGEIPMVTGDALSRLGAKETIILGGPVAVSDEVAALLPEVTRIEGADRYETAVRIATAIEEVQDIDTIVVTDGINPDLTAAMLADYYRAPIVYVKGGEVPEATREYLTQHKTNGVKRVLLTGITEEAEKAIRELMTE
ncbi:cell wall-binding repeat-containing protein, partial [Candidatus Pyrohabitans sp.]